MLSEGLADDFHRFNLSSMLKIYPAYSKLFTSSVCGRPGCVIQKPLTLLWAMDTYPPGTWLFWMDSSQHYYGKAEVSVKRFTQILEQMGMDALPGAPLCKAINKNHGYVDDALFELMGLNEKAYREAPHYQNNFFVMRNTPKYRAFMEEWLKWMQHQETVARSHTEDQSVFSLLVTKHQIPALHFCHKNENYECGSDILKDSDSIRNETIDAWNQGTPLHVFRHAEFMELWKETNWRPTPW